MYLYQEKVESKASKTNETKYTSMDTAVAPLRDLNKVDIVKAIKANTIDSNNPNKCKNAITPKGCNISAVLLLKIDNAI